MSHGTVLCLVQFDFSYISSIITLNSALIIVLPTLRSNLIKAIYEI